MTFSGQSQLPPDVQRFLESNTRAFWFTLRKDGSPTGHPMTGRFAKGRVSINTYRKSTKARNIDRDSRTCCLVVNGYDAEKVHGVLVRGKARIVEPGMIPGSDTRQGSEVSGSVAARSQERLRSGKRVIIEITPSGANFL